jgi:hypothetical protein
MGGDVILAVDDAGVSDLTTASDALSITCSVSFLGLFIASTHA